jgi:hypothetical protein
MTSRATRFALGALTCIVTGASLVVTQLETVGAADECLASPKGASPSGQHWFYRVDRSTKRHCWYLGDRGKAASRATRSASARRALLVRLKRDNPPPVRDVDARAELVQKAAGDTLRAEDAQLTTQAMRNRPVEAQNAKQDLRNSSTGDDAQSLVAARWPDPADAATAARQAAFALVSAKSDAGLGTTTDPVPSASPASVDSANMPVTSNVDARPVRRASSVYSLFWAICGALVLVSFAGGATYFMTRAQATHEGWSVEPFDIARSASWLDQAKDISARLSATGRHAEVPRRSQPAGRLVT